MVSVFACQRYSASVRPSSESKRMFSLVRMMCELSHSHASAQAPSQTTTTNFLNFTAYIICSMLSNTYARKYMPGERFLIPEIRRNFFSFKQRTDHACN